MITRKIKHFFKRLLSAPTCSTHGYIVRILKQCLARTFDFTFSLHYVNIPTYVIYLSTGWHMRNKRAKKRNMFDVLFFVFFIFLLALNNLIW